jgi:hypothetical protein
MASLVDLHWYVAVLVFESHIREARSDPSIDIQFRLVRAAGAEAAYERALLLGQESAHAYENTYGQTCVWSFKGLKDLQEVIDNELIDGVEVYGFIEAGTAEDHVVAKSHLSVFFKGSIDENLPEEAGDL